MLIPIILLIILILAITAGIAWIFISARVPGTHDVKGSVLEHKRSEVKATIGVCLVILCAMGAPLAVYGLYLVVAGSISQGNLAGLLVIFGLPMLIGGIILLCGLVPSFRLMKRNLEGNDRLTSKEIKILVLVVVIPALAVIFFLTQQRLNRIAYDKLTQDFDIYEPTPEMIRSMKQRITNEFRKHKTLFLTVRYFPPESGELADPESIKNYGSSPFLVGKFRSLG